MGWETRRNGRRYYYEKVRTPDGRVVSRYVGAGTLGALAAEINELVQARREQDRAVERRERARHEESELVARELDKLTRLLTHGSLLASGYHTHKGQWRQSRRRSK